MSLASGVIDYDTVTSSSSSSFQAVPGYSMGIRFACHECDKRLNVKRDLAGKRGVCPQCSTRFRIPIEDADQSTPIVDAHSRSADSMLATATSARAAVRSNDSESSIDLLVNDPTSTWYVRPPTGGQYGPASSEVLRSWIDQGRVAANSLLWRDGWPQWRAASEVLPDLVRPVPKTEPSLAIGNGATGSGSTADTIAPEETVVLLGGRADLGAERRDRSSRRIISIAVLVVVAIVLVVALIIIVNRQ